MRPLSMLICLCSHWKVMTVFFLLYHVTFPQNCFSNNLNYKNLTGFVINEHKTGGFVYALWLICALYQPVNPDKPVNKGHQRLGRESCLVFIESLTLSLRYLLYCTEKPLFTTTSMYQPAHYSGQFSEFLLYLNFR